MIDPKLFEYFTDETVTTDNGYEYRPLKEDTPKEILDDYMEFIKEQDERFKNNEPVMML